MKMKEYERVIGEDKRFCKGCGARIKSIRRRAYCSAICNQRSHSKRKLARTYKCAYCGKGYHAWSTSLHLKKKAKNHFCSHEHYLLWKRKKASRWGKGNSKVKRAVSLQKKVLKALEKEEIL
jgi:hypothetical protein